MAHTRQFTHTVSLSALLLLPLGCSAVSGLLGRASSGGGASSASSSSASSASSGSGGSGRGVASNASPADQALSETGPGPQTAQEYHDATQRCQPSCYEPQRRFPELTVNVDGYRTCHVYQLHELSGEWDHTLLGCAMQNPVAVRPYRVPPVPGHFRDLMAEATAVGRDRDVISSDSVVVPAPHARWEPGERDDDTGLPQRSLEVRVYASGMEFGYPPCGVQDGLAVCEPSGSKAVTGFNAARYRLQEAQRHAQQRHRNACRVAAWQSWAFARDVKSFHERLVRSGDWTANRHYATRYDGVRSEAELLRAVDETERAALDQFHQCGGQGEPQLTSDEQNGDLLQWQFQVRSQYGCADVPDGTVPGPDTNLHCAAHGSQVTQSR